MFGSALLSSTQSKTFIVLSLLVLAYALLKGGLNKLSLMLIASIGIYLLFNTYVIHCAVFGNCNALAWLYVVMASLGILSLAMPLAIFGADGK